MRTQRKNSRHTRKQNLACLTCVSFQYYGCVEVIIIIKVISDSIRLWLSILLYEQFFSHFGIEPRITSCTKYSGGGGGGG